jgi:hypothetical protein
MAYREFEEGYAMAAADKRKADIAGGLEKAFQTFRTVRDTRVKKQQESEDFKLDNQIKMLKLKQLGNDPTQDPAVLEATRRQLKLGASIKEKESQLALKKLTRDEHLITNQAQVLKEQGRQLIMDQASDPDIFGNLTIDPSTGAYVQKEKQDMPDSEIIKQAAKLATTRFGGFDQDKFEAAYNTIKSKVRPKAPVGGDEGMVQMRAPDGSISSVPKSSVEKYRNKGASIVE